jgi:hypothetical protein
MVVNFDIGNHWGGYFGVPQCFIPNDQNNRLLSEISELIGLVFIGTLPGLNSEEILREYIGFISIGR